MKKLTFSLLFCSLALFGYSTTWTVINVGFSFSPSTLTIQEGDTVIFDIDSEHNVAEVSQSTWNSNGNTPLSGGFLLGFGGGMILPSQLEVGNHWYVCQPHANMGMKGMIIVELGTDIEEPEVGTALRITPNPATDKIQVFWSNPSTSKEYTVSVVDMNGRIIYQTSGRGEQILTQNLEINLTDYPRGTYYVRVRDNEGIHSRKVLLQ